MAGLGEGQKGRKDEPAADRDDGEIDVPQHPRPDQRKLIAQGEVGARQQAFAHPKRPQAVILNGLKATHAVAFPLVGTTA